MLKQFLYAMLAFISAFAGMPPAPQAVGYADAHADTITAAMDQGQGLYENSLHIDIARLKAFNAPVVVFAVWYDPKLQENPFDYTDRAIRFFLEQIAFYPDDIALALTGEDIAKNIMLNKISAVLALEGGEALMGDTENIRYFHGLGVRIIAPTWNSENALGYGQAAGDGGLKPFGKECVLLMNELGIIIDVSHLNDAGFWDADALCDTYMASHSNARSVTDHKRNLTDAQIQAISAKNGFIGINLYPPFLGGASEENLLAHIRFMRDLGAGDVLGLGCDFDGIEQTPDFAKDVSGVNNIARILEGGFGVETTRGIMYWNLIEFLMRAL